MIRRDTLRNYPGVKEIVNPGQGKIGGVAIDTRVLKPGDMFFALRGEGRDGHEFIPVAEAGGASLIVADEKWFNSDKFKGKAEYWIVDDTVKALQGMALEHRRQFKGEVIALTGSNGKTTTKEMLYRILSIRYKVHKNEGNFNNHLGVPLTLFGIEDEHQLAIVEMGTNHPGEIPLLCEIAEPTMGLVTNIGSAHIGYFPDTDSLAREKQALMHFVCERGGRVFINTFDREFDSDKCRGEVFTIGSGNENYVSSTRVEINSDEIGIRFDADGINIELPLPGYHNRYNALLAAAVGKSLGITVREAAKVLSEFHAVGQRMELINTGGLKIIDDCYNASPESMAAAITYAVDLAGQTGEDLHLILGDMLELGVDSPRYHREIASQLTAKEIKSVWLAGEQMRFLFEKLQGDKLNFQVQYRDGTSSLAELLKKSFAGRGIVLVKASRGMHLETIITLLKDIEGEKL